MAIIRMTMEEVLKHQPSQQQINQLHALKDEDIDFSEMPKFNQSFWEKAMTPAQFRAYRKNLKENSLT